MLFVNLIVHLNIQVFSRSYISSFPNNNRYCNHATSHANSKAFGLLPRGLSPYSMRVVLGSYEFEDLRSSSSQASPYKKRDNMNCLRVNSHNPHCPYFCMGCSLRECSQRESNPQLALRRRVLYAFNYENL